MLTPNWELLLCKEVFKGLLGPNLLGELIVLQINFSSFFPPTQPLDFETVAVHNIVFQAENPEPLVSGVNYNTSSSAKFKLIVTDVNEAPQFSQRIYQEKIREDVAVGTKVGNVTAKDPENLDIR